MLCFFARRRPDRRRALRAAIRVLTATKNAPPTASSPWQLSSADEGVVVCPTDYTTACFGSGKAQPQTLRATLESPLRLQLSQSKAYQLSLVPQADTTVGASETFRVGWARRSRAKGR